MTPYDAIFSQPEFETELFPAITADAETHDMDTRNVDSFLQMPGTNALIEKIAPAGMLGGPVAGITALSFHGYHFWRAGKHVDVGDALPGPQLGARQLARDRQAESAVEIDGSPRSFR